MSVSECFFFFNYHTTLKEENLVQTNGNIMAMKSITKIISLLHYMYPTFFNRILTYQIYFF